MTEARRRGHHRWPTAPALGPGAARRVVVAAALLGVSLSACSMPPRFGVSTTVVKPTGTCDRSRVVEIGASLALSGSQGPLGREYLTGLKMAVDHVDSTGGVLKHHECLELLYKDDQGSVPIAKRAVRDLIDQEQVSFLVSPFLSTQVEGASAALARSNIPVVSFSSLDQTFRRAAYPWTFPLSSSTSTTAAAMLHFAQTQAWHRVAVVATDDPAGREGAASLASAAPGHGVMITAEGSIPAGRHADEVLERLQASHPVGLVLVGDTLAVTAALRARGAIGWHVPVVASSIAVDPNVVKAVGTAGLAGVSVVVPQAIVAQAGIPDGDVRSFRDRLRAQLQHPVLTGSIIPFAQGYDAISMLASAVQNAHSLTAANVRTFLENANYQGLLASYTYTTSTHSGIPSNQQRTESASRLSDGIFPATNGPRSGEG